MYVFRFFKFAWLLRRDYDVVLVHMNQEYVLLGALLWRLCRKKIFMWRNHYAGSLLARLAVRLCDNVFSTSSDSYTAQFRKNVIMPIGVGMKMFQIVPGIERTSRSILFLARMAPSKRPDVFLDALEFLAKEGVEYTATIVGSPAPGDEAFYQNLQERAKLLGARIQFVPGVPHGETPAFYASHDVFVNTSKSGMYDKTIVEAAASGCIVIASSRDFAEAFDGGFSFDYGDGTMLAGVLMGLLRLEEPAKEKLRNLFREFAENHALPKLAGALIAHMSATSFVFVSTFDYPTRFAHALHGLAMARAFSALLGGRFLFFVNTARRPPRVEHIELFGVWGRRVKKLRLRRFLILPRLFFFFLFRREWRGADLYTTEPGLYLSLFILRALFGGRTVFECHGRGREYMWALSRADHVFFPTQTLRDDFIQGAPQAESKARALPNAVDTQAFSAVSSDITALRAELRLPPGFLVGYIGRFEPLGFDKGLKLMIDALATLRHDTHLILVGGVGREVAAYEAYARAAGVLERVTIVPHVDASLVPKYAKAVDVLAYVPPKNTFTEEETSPMKLFEYLASGRPVVVSDTAAFRAIVGEDAWLIEPDSVHAFVKTVRHIRAHPLEAEEKAARALARAASLTWENRARAIVEVLEP